MQLLKAQVTNDPFLAYMMHKQFKKVDTEFGLFSLSFNTG